MFSILREIQKVETDCRWLFAFSVKKKKKKKILVYILYVYS